MFPSVPRCDRTRLPVGIGIPILTRGNQVPGSGKALLRIKVGSGRPRLHEMPMFIRDFELGTILPV